MDGIIMKRIKSWAACLISTALAAAFAASSARAQPPLPQGVRGDFNGDAQIDVLWRHVNSHRLAVWFMDEASRITGTLLPDPPPQSGWKPVGTADFDGDTKTDIVWRNSTSGNTAIWFMDGIQHVGGQLVDPAPMATVQESPSSWVFVGTGDFNGDGQDDFVWKNVAHDIFQGYIRIWEIEPAAATSPAVALQEEETNPDERIDLDWYIAGLGDMTADGQANVDLLWRHTPTNALEIWRMNHYQRVGVLPIVIGTGETYPGPEWVVAGLWDLNADGRTDILWHHQLTGELLIWFMNDVVKVGEGHLNPPAVPDTQWQIVGPR